MWPKKTGSATLVLRIELSPPTNPVCSVKLIGRNVKMRLEVYWSSGILVVYWSIRTTCRLVCILHYSTWERFHNTKKNLGQTFKKHFFHQYYMLQRMSSWDRGAQSQQTKIQFQHSLLVNGEKRENYFKIAIHCWREHRKSLFLPRPLTLKKSLNRDPMKKAPFFQSPHMTEGGTFILRSLSPNNSPCVAKKKINWLEVHILMYLH